MKRIILWSIVAVLLLGTVVTMGAANQITIVTEEYPPFNFTGDDGKFTGLSTDVLREVLAEVGITAKIEPMAWSRAYNLALNQPNVLIYSIGRTPAREDLFSWIGVVANIEYHLFALANSGISLNSLNDARQYKIGVVRDDLGDEYLQGEGFSRELVAIANIEQSLKQLLTKRIDLIHYSSAPLIQGMRDMGEDPDGLESVFLVEELSIPLNMAFSKQTDQALVHSFQQALESLKEEGRLAAIQKKWLE